MNDIRQHIPNYVEGFTPRAMAFETLEELVAIDWVKQFSEPKEPMVLTNVLTGEQTMAKSSGPFYRFSQSQEWENRWLLMAEFDEGKSWWVVGYMKERVEDLPAWQHPTPD